MVEATRGAIWRDRAGVIWTRHRRAVLIAVAAGILLVVLAGGSQPAVCASCHTMEPFANGLEGGAHASVSCYSCHLDNGAWDWPAFKLKELTVMYPRAFSSNALQGPTRESASSACLRCHSSVMDALTSKGGLRIAHKDCAQGASCDGCHSTVAHGAATRWIREPVMEACVECHRDSDAPIECDACHEDKSQTERLSRGPWQVTHGPQWRNTHGMGSLRHCATCHPADYCVRCHGVTLPHTAGFGRTHGTEAQAPDAKCLDCHDKVALCDACHGASMPHPAGFLARHSAEASSSKDEVCLRCHRSEDCLECHTRHAHPGRTEGTLGDPETGAIVGPGGGR